MNARAIHIGLVDAVHESCRLLLEKNGLVVHDLSVLPESETRNAIGKMDAIVVRSRFPFDRAFMEANRHLKCIGRWGSGLENIDLDAAKAFGIAVVNAPEGNRQAVAEHALLLLLSMMRHMPRIDTEVRAGVWQREPNRGTELQGKTIAIIGYGHTGSAFARVLAGFRVKVLAFDKYRSGFSDEYISEATLDDVFQHADVISLHLPQSEETKHYVDADFIARFQKPVYLLNTARGQLIDAQALLQGINSGSIICAGLDVLPFETSSFEQLDNDPQQTAFLQHPQMVFSPHIAGWTHEANTKMAKWLTDKMIYLLRIEKTEG